MTNKPDSAGLFHNRIHSNPGGVRSAKSTRVPSWKTKNEWTPSEYRNAMLFRGAPSPTCGVAKGNCDQHLKTDVFRCRHSDGGGCGQICCACYGGGMDNLCASCWVSRKNQCKCNLCENDALPQPGCLLYEPECEVGR